MSGDPFDRLFEEAMDQAVKNKGDIPDPGESWKRVDAKLKRSRKRSNRLRVLPYVASSFLIGALLFSSGLTKAFTPLFDSLIQARDGVTRVVFGAEDMIHESPPVPLPSDDEPADEDQLIQMVDSEVVQTAYHTWEEAERAFPYPLPLKPKVPEGFALDTADIYLSSPTAPAKQAAAIFTYMDEGKKHVIHLSIEWLSPGSKMRTDYKDKDGSLKVVKFRGEDAFLFETLDGQSSFDFLSGDLYVTLRGAVPADTLLFMAGVKE